MTQDEIIEMAIQAGLLVKRGLLGRCSESNFEAFAKLVAAHAVAKDSKEFDIDELCARQNKIGYKQGYNAGVLAEREACVKAVADALYGQDGCYKAMRAIRARGEA